MENVILLKTQLAEAAKYGKSKDFRFQRLAVILLDNFVEIKLNSLAKQKFMFDTELSKYTEKKYSEKKRKKILTNYDELLKFSLGENTINEKEKYLLLFCHDVRNNLYHSIYDEELLVTISLKILKNFITEKQPLWGNVNFITQYNGKMEDPYKSKSASFNTADDWKFFLAKHFNFIDKRTSNSSNLLKKFILQKMSIVRDNYKFLMNEYADYFPYAKNWGFNDFIFTYSFKYLHQKEIEEIKEINKVSEREKQRKSLEAEYKQNWKNKKFSRIKAIEQKAKSMSRLEISKSLEVYISLRDEINIIYEGLKNAANDLNSQIDLEQEMANGN